MIERSIRCMNQVVKIMNPSWRPQCLRGYMLHIKVKNDIIEFYNDNRKPRKSKEITISNDSPLSKIITGTTTYYNLAREIEKYFYEEVKDPVEFCPKKDDRIFLKVYLGNNDCVKTACSIYSLLKRSNIDAHVVYGLAKCEDNDMFYGHAWVVYKDPADGNYYRIDASVPETTRIPLYYLDMPLKKLLPFSTITSYTIYPPRKVVFVKNSYRNIYNRIFKMISDDSNTPRAV